MNTTQRPGAVRKSGPALTMRHDAAETIASDTCPCVKRRTFVLIT